MKTTIATAAIALIAAQPSETPRAGRLTTTKATLCAPVIPPSGKCLASWYHANPRHTAMWGTKLVVAHRTLRPGTRLRVTRGAKRVDVTVCGYGPATWTKRDLDLSREAFAVLASPSVGVMTVEWRVIR